MGHTKEAVDWFHRALGLKNDDSFCTTMLNYVIEQLSEEEAAFPGEWILTTLGLFQSNIFSLDNPDYIPTYLLQSNLQDTNATDMSIEGGSQMSMSIEMADVSGMIRDWWIPHLFFEIKTPL